MGERRKAIFGSDISWGFEHPFFPSQSDVDAMLVRKICLIRLCRQQEKKHNIQTNPQTMENKSKTSDKHAGHIFPNLPNPKKIRNATKKTWESQQEQFNKTEKQPGQQKTSKIHNDFKQ